MSIDDHVHIETEDFDREYGLADLLPASLAAELLAGISAAIALPDGGRYQGDLSLTAGQAALLEKELEAGAEHGFCETDQGEALAFALVHELETIAYLVIPMQRGPASDSALIQLGRLAARALNRMIYLTYKTRMAAGLHGRVVTESYASLKEKAEQLRRSEEKYRHLAENLEIEVQNKTREIKEAQLNLLRQEKMAAVGQLAAGMAHEINNPIGFVISNLNTLKETFGETHRILAQYRKLGQGLGPLPANGAQAVKIKELAAGIERLCETLDLDFKLQDTQDLIQESLAGGERVKRIVRTLCDFTHPSVETPETIDVNACLEVTLAILSGQIPPGVRITKSCQKVPPLRGYLREINQVFFNILQNALQAVGEKGVIEIATASAQEKIEIIIRDNGSGIRKEDLPRIFDPFFTTREVGRGVGLGLNLTYNIVKKHGGQITAESVEGQGSAFTVRFPSLTASG
jgi:signal transduction histidine kinase